MFPQAQGRTGYATNHMEMDHYWAIFNDHCHSLGLHNTACHQYLLAEGCNINIYKADTMHQLNH